VESAVNAISILILTAALASTAAGQPPVVGVSCPYCLTMLSDASKAAEKDEQVKVRDVLEILADRLPD